MRKLAPRLQCIVSFIKPCSSVADIGTDHGYIPCYLALSGFDGRIIASDINEKPLNKARLSAKENGVSDKIEFILSDGLSGINSCVDTVVIAGMGGDAMIHILSCAPWPLDNCHLILQPQSKLTQLTEWLASTDLEVDDAKLVRDAGKLYTVLSVRKAKDRKYVASEGDFLVPRALFTRKDTLLPDYLLSLSERYRRIADGYDKAKISANDRSDVMQKLKILSDMMTEVSEWQK